MEGQIDINEITGPMRDAVERLGKEIAEIEGVAAKVEQEHQAEAAQLLRKGAEEAAPYRQVVADKRAAMSRWQLLIAREENEAGVAVPPDTGVTVTPTPTLTDGQLDTGEAAGNA
jgi:hypothetical protein